MNTKKMNILKTIYHFFSSNKKICSLYIKGCNMTILVTMLLVLFWEKGKITSIYHLTTSLNYFCRNIKRKTKKIKNTMMQTDYSKNLKSQKFSSGISETSLETASVNICWDLTSLVLLILFFYSVLANLHTSSNKK